MCVKDMPEACAEAETMLKKSFDGMINATKSMNLTLLSYDNTKVFVNEQCPKFPAGEKL